MGLFAGIAEGAAPGIQQVLDMLNQIDLSGFGQQLGKILGAFVQAFKEGKLSELIGDSLRLGFDSILIFSPGIFQKIGYELLKAFETPLNFLEAGLTWIELKFVEMLAKFESSLPKGIQNAIGFDDRFKGFKAPSFGEVFKDRQDRGLEMGLVNLGEINASADKSLAEAGKKFREKWEAFQFGLDSFNSRAPKLKPSENFTKTGGVSLARESYTFKPEFNAFEKMGFVMRGGMTNPATEYARRTADNTTKMTSLLEATVQLLGSGGAEPVNAPL
jgi:hypothetical protein